MIEKIENTESLSRRERERAQHRAEIMNAAIDVFGKKGFYAATLDEIAQRAEFSKGTLYLYFQSKEDLLFSILRESMEVLTAISDDILQTQRPFREQITEMFTRTGNYLFEQPHLFALMSAQHGAFFKALSKENREMLHDLHNNTWTIVTERVHQAIREKEIREVRAEAVTGMVHGSIDSMIHSRWDCETKECLNKAIEAFMDIIFNGIALRKE